MLAVLPGLAIVLMVLGLNLMGDGLRDALDPLKGACADACSNNHPCGFSVVRP
jgi:hypothetical protein